MKAGLTIEELATEVMRQKDAKADYIVNTSMLAMEHCGMVNIPGHSKGLCALKITGSDGRFILLLRRWRLRPKIVGAADHIRHCR